MSAVERAAEVMRHCQQTAHGRAQALADAGLLATDEEIELRQLLADSENSDMQAIFERACRQADVDRAVLDAADKWEREAFILPLGADLAAAVRARREAQR